MFSVEIFILLCVYFPRAYSQQWSQQSLANLQQQMNGFTFPFSKIKILDEDQLF